MMPELKSFTANATPEVRTEVQNYQTYICINTRSRVVSSLSSVLPTSQVFTSGYVNTETILYFFYKITNERGMKTVFTYAHVKLFYGQSERMYYLNYFINYTTI